jgi:D-psicose/D-tagatose/L-ribulose 3-epimerase
MKIGVNTLLWGGAFTTKSIPLLARVKKLGFDGAEIPLFAPDEVDVPAVRAAFGQLGLKPIGCFCLPPEANPISPEARCRAKAVPMLKQIIRLVKDLGGSGIGGPLYAPVGYKTGAPPSAQEWKWAVKFFREVTPFAEDVGVTLCIEPINRFETFFINTAAAAVALCREVSSPMLKVHLDAFHMNIEEKDSPAAIRLVGKRLGHFHVSESDRGIPGTGQVDWPSVFKALRDVKYDGWLVIESFHSSVKEIAAATCIWRKLAPSPDTIAVEGRRLIQRYCR